MADHSWSGLGRRRAGAGAAESAVLGLLRDGLGVTGAPVARRTAPELPASRLGGEVAARLAGGHRRGARADQTRRRGSVIPGGSRRSICSAPGPGTPARRRTPWSCRAATRRCWSSCASAPSERIAVVPFGGGTSVVGGLAPDAAAFAAALALDVRRMNALVALDEASRVAVLGPGLRGPEAEALLAQRGYTLGHFPQSFEYATIGGFAATRSSGQASAGYGRFDDLVVALRVATPAGTLELGRAPRSAAGPDLRQLVLGSEGVLGVITAVTRGRCGRYRRAASTRGGGSNRSRPGPQRSERSPRTARCPRWSGSPMRRRRRWASPAGGARRRGRAGRLAIVGWEGGRGRRRGAARRDAGGDRATGGRG